MVLLSEMYGKQIISNDGKRMGTVEDLILDFEDGKIASMLTTKIDNLIKSEHTAQLLKKNSVSYDRVKSVSETVIVGSSEQKR
ncbi:MAG: PRC-barrel domain-containing protein [Candidatus Marsarchaeota archaeon]|nr:PRC-barrel domain-containing protein [Candidatus Marsarchaeota archaeon]MCL5102172.1 PRC-barrel domain-containing protein [Candidatus Marsarchaeota archaeon]